MLTLTHSGSGWFVYRATDILHGILLGNIIWRQHHGSADWFKTAHVVTARTDVEAQAKTKRLMQNAGLHSMSLVAVKEGSKP